MNSPSVNWPVLLAVSLMALGTACTPHDGAPDGEFVGADHAESATTNAVRHEPISPIPFKVEVDARKVALGKKLFHEPMLSRDGTISCASCHDLAHGGTDHLERSVGLAQARGAVSAPTVFNSGFNFRQFWNGRADSLEKQVDGPLLSPDEMGASWDGVIAKLSRDAGYAAAFRAIYPGGITPKHVRETIAEFERSLITPNSRFDRYLRGDNSALSAAELAGYAKFKDYGCTSCHQGVNVGANMFQRMGVMRDYFAERGNVTEADFGRFNITKNEADKFFFKVPSLRNVAVTAPYFHDGSAHTLQEAVAAMAKYQLGRPLPREDLAEIVAFLQTLTGEYEGRPITP